MAQEETMTTATDLVIGFEHPDTDERSIAAQCCALTFAARKTKSAPPDAPPFGLQTNEQWTVNKTRDLGGFINSHRRAQGDFVITAQPSFYLRDPADKLTVLHAIYRGTDAEGLNGTGPWTLTLANAPKSCSCTCRAVQFPQQMVICRVEG
jgi:hypothetical protein